MLYIDNKSEHSLVLLPKNTVNFPTNFTFSLKSQATAQEYSFEKLSDLSGLTDYVAFEIDATSIPDGEYEATCETEKIVARIGTIQHTATAYTKEVKYKCYQY